MTGLPVFFTTAEVAEALKITPTALRRLVADGKASPIRLSDSDRSPMRFSGDDVAALVAALRPPPAVPKARRRRNRGAA
jgi:hypothetical protein